MHIGKTDIEGVLMCAWYAVSPNFFGYCGPRKSKSIIDHLKEHFADKEMEYILKEFETLYPYLQLIAKENNIVDPFNKHVVEAYWIGNSLLKHIPASYFSSFLDEKLMIRKKTGSKQLAEIHKHIVSTPVFPHHTFHVFNIFRGMNKNLDLPVVQTMNECRIGWGKIQVKSENSPLRQGYEGRVKVNSLLIKTRSLILVENKLKLGETVLKELKLQFREKEFIHKLKVGDWVSYHWGYVCDLLTIKQVRNLAYFTNKAIDSYNISNT